jgi:acylphosphatase
MMERAMRPAEGQMIRRRVLYSGQVQGVGFRFTAREAAAAHAVAGFVRNLRSGQVEVVAEGPPGELDAFLSDLASRMAGYISSARTEEAPATGEFDGFEVRFGS